MNKPPGTTHTKMERAEQQYRQPCPNHKHDKRCDGKPLTISSHNVAPEELVLLENRHPP